MAEDTTSPPPAAGGDPFAVWYRDVIQAHPERYDPAHFSEAQARAWFPLWNPATQGFRSSKVDIHGNPIPGDSFAHPDECPPGMAAYGPSACAPVGYGAGAGGGGGGGGGFGAGFGDFSYQPFDMAYPEFKAPTAAEAQAEPGYQFGLQQGQGALEASAAAKGVLHTGGTLADILKYGQDYASQRYGDVFGRAKDIYGSKLGAYKSAWDKYQADRGFDWGRYTFGKDDEFRRQQMLLGAQPPGY